MALYQNYLRAKSRNQLLKAKTIAEELGFVENKDFFLIRDACHTELEPEEFDEKRRRHDPDPHRLASARRLLDELHNRISYKFHLY